MRRRIEEKPVFWYNTLMSVNDLTNLGIEADLPEELRRISATTEHQALLQHFGIGALTLNTDIWTNAAEQRRLAGMISRNVAGRIATTRHALSEVQLANLLTPRIQAASELVAQRDAGTPERAQAVATVLAQAIYDALPKEILHVVIEQEIANTAPAYRAPYTATEQDAARKFYEKLRAENDANDMVAGMAMFMAMHDATARPAGVAAVPASPGPPPTPAVPAVVGWEQKYIVNNTETVSRKNVAETVQKLKSFQPIVLPSALPQNANRQQVSDARDRITDGTTGHIRRIDDHLSAWAATETANQTQQTRERNELNQWEADKREHELLEQRRQNEITQLRETYRQECLSVQETNKAAAERHRSECVIVEQANQRDIDAYRAQIATLAVGGTPPPMPTPRPLPPSPTPIPLPGVPAAPAAIPPLRARPVESPLASFPLLTLVGAFGATLANPADARGKQVEYATTAANLQGVMDEFTRRENTLNDLLRVIQALNVSNFSATFPTFSAICTGTPPVVNPAAIQANFDFAGLAAEIERNFPNGLKSVEEYSKEVVESGKNKPSGLDLSKSVIRSHVKTQRPSLSASDIESVSNYIINRTKVDGILRSSVDETMNHYLDVSDRTIGDSLSNNWYGDNHEWFNRRRSTIDEIAAALRVPRRGGEQPNWQVASYEQASAAYYAIKELVDGKGPKDLLMTSKPQIAIENMRTLARILSTKYAGQMEAKLLASLPEDQKKNVTRSRARLAQELQSALTGDTPDWVNSKVSAAHARADKRVDWFSRGAYDITSGTLKAVSTNVGSWLGTGVSGGFSGATKAVKHYGADAAKIAAFSLLGGPVIGIAAWYAMKHFEKPSSK